MNVDSLRGVRAVRTALVSLVVLGVAVLPGTAAAQSWRERFDNVVLDPLLVRPPVLDAGAILPGDDVPLQCPSRVTQPGPLLLGEAIDAALCNNAQLRVAWASIKMQAARVGEARAAYFPSVSVGVRDVEEKSHMVTSLPVQDTDRRSYSEFANLTWRLLDSGARSANQRAADAMLASALASHDAALQKTMVAAVSAYFDAQTAHAYQEAKIRATGFAQNTLDTVVRRAAQGAASQSDVLQAEVALAKAELNRSRAQGAYDRAILSLLYAMGGATDDAARAALVLAPLQDEASDEAMQDLSQWFDLAQQQHPAIVAARHQLDAAKERLVVVRAEGLATLDLSHNRQLNRRSGTSAGIPQSDETSIALSLNFPLFEGFSRTYKVRGAQAQIEARQAEWQEISNNVLSELGKANAEAVAALNNLVAARKLADAAQGALASAQRRYQHGVSDVLEILAAQAALADAQQEHIRGLAEWRSARLRVIGSAGVLGRDQTRVGTTVLP